MDSLLLSRKETAAILGVSIRTLENLVNAGELRPRRIGRRRLFERRSVELFSRRDHRTRPAQTSEATVAGGAA